MTIQKKELSIVIPTLNEEKAISKMLKHLRKIKSFNYEIIVSDGNSKDRTIALAKKYADKVIVYRGKKRQTIGGGRNLGAKSAKGEYLLFLDADVTIPNIDNFLKRALSNFQAIPNLLALTVNFRVLKKYESFADYLVYSYMNTYNRLSNNLFGVGAAGGEFQLIKRDAFNRVNGYNEELVASEDYELMMRLSKRGKTYLDSTLTIFHTGRRSRKVGWPKLLLTWFTNWLSMIVFNKANSTEWEAVR